MEIQFSTQKPSHQAPLHQAPYLCKIYWFWRFCSSLKNKSFYIITISKFCPLSYHYGRNMQPFPNPAKGLWEVILDHLSESWKLNLHLNPASDRWIWIKKNVAERGSFEPMGCSNNEVAISMWCCKKLLYFRWDVQTKESVPPVLRCFLMSRWSGDPPNRFYVRGPWPQRPHGQIHIARPNRWWLCWGPGPQRYDQIRMGFVRYQLAWHIAQ